MRVIPPRSEPPWTPPIDPRSVVAPSRDIYAAMGEENIFAMLADFYVRLETSSIRWMFADDMREASRRSAAFFVGLLGGPPLYLERYGRPMMRARHLPFPIDPAARGIWLSLFLETLEDAPTRYRFPAQHLDGFKAFLDGFSAWMMNTAPTEADTPASP